MENRKQSTSRPGSRQKPRRQTKVVDTYKRIKQLGKGAFGTVFLVECGSDKSQAAIKQIDLASMDKDQRAEVEEEIKLLSKMHHPNIILMKEAYTTKGGKKNIVMQVADGDNLNEEIKHRLMVSKCQNQSVEYFKEKQILNWLTQICLALNFIHDRNILHRDIKPENILKTKSGVIKIGDFGISKQLENTYQEAKTDVGTPLYLSPEIVKGEVYTKSTDIWSLGITMYEICQFKCPFEWKVSLMELNQNILSGCYDPLPARYSKELQSIIYSMLEQDPKKRPSARQLLMHPLIVENINSLVKSKEYKNQFSKGVLINDQYFDEYSSKQSDLDPEKAGEYDKTLDLKDHGAYVGCHNMQEPIDFAILYGNFIHNINPHRKKIQE